MVDCFFVLSFIGFEPGRGGGRIFLNAFLGGVSQHRFFACYKFCGCGKVVLFLRVKFDAGNLGSLIDSIETSLMLKANGREVDP